MLWNSYVHQILSEIHRDIHGIRTSHWDLLHLRDKKPGRNAKVHRKVIAKAHSQPYWKTENHPNPKLDDYTRGLKHPNWPQPLKPCKIVSTDLKSSIFSLSDIPCLVFFSVFIAYLMFTPVFTSSQWIFHRLNRLPWIKISGNHLVPVPL